MALASIVAAASVLVGVGLAYQFLGKSAPPLVAGKGIEPETLAFNPPNEPAQPKTVSADGLQWDDALDEQFNAMSRNIYAARNAERNALSDFANMHSRLDALRQDLERNSL